MILHRIKSEGLAHNSYLVGSQADAIVIDPRRDCQVYLDLAEQEGMRIRAVFETHRNEDYAIGSVELAHLTGAEVFHGPGLDWRYGTTLRDNQAFRVGKLRLTVLHTPGHTDESACYVVADAGGAPHSLFTGDTLFVGDTGRIDLYGPEEAPRLAEDLHRNIFERLLPLGDGVVIYPGHSGGSVCGARISLREVSALGYERAHNPSLQRTDVADFVRHKLAEKLERPPYFLQMEKMNLEGPPLLEHLPVPPPLGPAEAKREVERGAVVVDTSMPPSFAGAHIQGAYSLRLDILPSYAGWVLPYDRPILLVLEDPLHRDRAVRSLIRLGYDNILGHLRGGIPSWYEAGYHIESNPVQTVEDLRNTQFTGGFTVLDVRTQEEWDEGHIEGAVHIPVGHLPHLLDKVPKDKPVCTVCGVGSRSGLAASILLRADYGHVANVLGGMTAWRARDFPVKSEQREH